MLTIDICLQSLAILNWQHKRIHSKIGVKDIDDNVQKKGLKKIIACQSVHHQTSVLQCIFQ
jgi:hypothetical protein